MKEKAKILICDDYSIGKNIAALAGNNLAMAGYYAEVAGNAIKLINIEYNSQSFIQQKMQGKRRVY
tara:strand:- start:4326 stop:4523 length:198 start_codon:yes stop_codon:yes gene_type:complete